MTKLIGQECLDATEAFEKKYAKKPKLIKEVQHLQNLLASWYAVVLLNNVPRTVRDKAKEKK